MTIKLCLRPQLNTIRENNGIGRVVYAQRDHLPALGFEFVDDPSQADLCIGHTQQFDLPRVDVLHVHGLYWLGDLDSGTYTSWHVGANDAIIEAARKARVMTVPSAWVAMPFKRDMRLSPHVIGHGINFEAWQPARNDGYVLWNKNRADDVCKPDAPYELAKRGIKIISTFAPKDVVIPDNMQLIGVQPSTVMHEMITHAGVYLATVKETFGIGTLEAMAAGVPVVGWRQGGTADLVTDYVDGLLVDYGDYEALANAVEQAQQNRKAWGKAAREKASRYDWRDVMKHYADLYTRTLDEIKREKHGVSIVITNHNYGRYVGEAIESALNQTVKPDEVIVVDDGSTDDSLDVLAKYPQTRVITQSNQGVAAARTTGITAAKQPYICLLDADDQLDPRFIESLLPVIDKSPDMGVVYSGLTLFDDQRAWLSDGFPPAFDWEKQAQATNPPSDCVPSACLFRREMWRRAGPHKQEYAPGEDAEFWTRALSVGYKAIKVTDAGLFRYRLHGASASRRLPYKRIDDRLPWLRDKRYPLAAPSNHAPLVMSYSEPRVSIIVAADESNVKHLPDCIDSITGQTMREWELIVVGQQIDATIGRYPFATWQIIDRENLGEAFNAGLVHAHAPLVMFMRASDMLTNSALEDMCKAHVNSGGRYIYPDTLTLGDSGEITPQQAADYSQSVWQNRLHGLTALIPTQWARVIGFAESLRTLQIEAFYSALAIGGYCGQRLGRPLVINRIVTERKPTVKDHRALKALEGIEMSSCCGGNGAAVLAAKQAVESMMTSVVPEGAVRLEYLGKQSGAVTYTINGRQYRGGNNDLDRYVDARKEDVNQLLSMGMWREAGIGITSRMIEAPQPRVKDVTAGLLPQLAAIKAFGDGITPPQYDTPRPMMSAPVADVIIQQAPPVVKVEPLPPIDGLSADDEAKLNEQVNAQMRAMREPAQPELIKTAPPVIEAPVKATKIGKGSKGRK